MQIKVKETRQYNRTNEKGGDTYTWDKLVAEGKWVLVKCSAKVASLTLMDGDFAQGYKPIIISETEKIERGDWFYWGGSTPQIQQSVYSSEPTDIIKKILVLSEQLSPQHLRDWVDGKIKDGDKVLVKCESIYSHADSVLKNKETILYSEIKLNSQGHVTLYKAEEKMVPISLIEEAFFAGYDLNTYEQVGGDIPFQNYKEWFEQNVK